MSPVTKYPIVSKEIGEKAALDARAKTLQAFENQGVTAELLAACGAELLRATKTKAQYVKGGVGEDGEFTPGHWAYTKPMKDNTTRYNTLKLLMEFHDVMPSKKVDVMDHRQTRGIVAGLFEALNRKGMLGIDEKTREIDGVDVVEAEVIKHNIPPRPVSINPEDMEEG
jgi:hypothetical protein